MAGAAAKSRECRLPLVLLFLASWAFASCQGQEATSMGPLIPGGKGRCGDGDGDGKLGSGSLMLRQPGALLAVEDGVIVCDLANSKIRFLRIASGTAEVLVDKADVDMPAGICLGADGSYFFTDLGNQQVKRLSEGSVSVVAGHKVPQEAAPTQDKGVMASMRAPFGIAADGQRMDLYVSDVLDNRIRKITRLTGVVEFFSGSGQAALRDGGHSDAAFHHPMGVAIGGESLFVADSKNHALRAVRISDGSVTTLAGTGERGNNDGRQSEARLDHPVSLLIKDEMIFVGDSDGRRVRRLSLASGTLSTLHQFETATPTGLAILPGQSPFTLVVSDSTNCGLERLSLMPGCDGKVLSAATNDRCGVCGGKDECLDCKGVPHGKAVINSCGVCGGDGSGCRPSPREGVAMPLDGTFVEETKVNGDKGNVDGNFDVIKSYVTKGYEQRPPAQSGSLFEERPQPKGPVEGKLGSAEPAEEGQAPPDAGDDNGESLIDEEVVQRAQEEDQDPPKGWLGGWLDWEDDIGSESDGRHDNAAHDGGKSFAMSAHDQDLLQEAMREKEEELKGEIDVAGRMAAQTVLLPPHMRKPVEEDGGLENGYKDLQDHLPDVGGTDASNGQFMQRERKGIEKYIEDDDFENDREEEEDYIDDDDFEHDSEEEMFGSKWWMIVVVLLFVVASFVAGSWWAKRGNSLVLGQSGIL